MDGFGTAMKVFSTVKPEQFCEAAGAKASGPRTAAEAMRSPDVSPEVKKALSFMSLVSKTIL